MPTLSGMSSTCPNLGPADIGWTWVDASSDATRIREVTGRVVPFALDTGTVKSSGDELEQSDLAGNRSSFLTHTDGPPYHHSHDFNTHIIVDEPLRDSLLAPTNDLDDDVEDEANNLADLHPSMMEVEWESGIRPDETHGDGTGGLDGKPIFPKWAWPSPGDRVWFMGNHIYDCGHSIELSDDNDYFKSEIHPAIAVATMRGQVMPLPGTGPTPVRVTATDLYIHGDGGFATSVLATNSIFGGDDENSTTSIARNYDFDIHLPPRPSPSAVLAHTLAIGPGNTFDTPETAPMFSENFSDPADPKLHVHVPLAGSGIPDLGVYARKIVAGWVEPEEVIRHFKITLNQMVLHEDMEIAGADGELSFFFLNVPQASNAWQRMSDFEVPTFEDPGILCADHTNIMDDYDDDGGCGNGVLNFSGPTFDLFVKEPKAGEVNPPPPIQILARGYDQDCYEDVMGITDLPGFLATADCSANPLLNGDNDLYNMWTAELAAPSYGVGTLHKANIDNQFELTFTVEEMAPPPQPRHLDLPAGGGTFDLFRDGVDLVVKKEGDGELFRFPVDSVTKFTINGSPDADKLVVDFSGGDPIPDVGGIDFKANHPTTAPGDSLELRGGHADRVTHSFTNDHDGTVVLEIGPKTSTINYSGLEPIADNMDADNRVFTFTGGAETITLSDDAGGLNGKSLIDSTLGEAVTFKNPTTSLIVNAGTGADTVNVTGLDAAFATPVAINGGAGADAITINDLPGTLIHLITVDLGSGDADVLNLDATVGPDNVSIAKDGTVVDVSGLAARVRVSGATTADTLNLFGRDGNDVIQAEAGVETLVQISLKGGPGDDFVSGAGRLDGGPGDDTLEGGAGVDTFNGGPGFDTVLIRGTAGNDSIFVDQTAAGLLSHAINGVNEQDETINGVEQVRIEAGEGDDTVAVRVKHGLDAASLRFDVAGGAPNASDRLLVLDDGPGNLIVSREAPDRRSGSITVGGLAPVAYGGVEFVQVGPQDPVTGGTGSDGAGRVVVFDTDPFEMNNDRRNPTDVESVAAVPVRPNIDPAGSTITDPFGNPVALGGDEDWYRFRAPKIGTFRFDVLFEEIAGLSNGQPGLPGAGNLDIAVYGAAGALVAGGTAVAQGEQVLFSAAAGGTYYLRVRGHTPDAINVYRVGPVVEADLLGPQVTNVTITGSAFDLFDPKPSTAGPTPRVDSLTVSLQDLPPRAPGDVYPTLDAAVAGADGHYRLVGDQNGVIAISRIVVTNSPVAAGQLATASVQLLFAQPLPDDRYTLTVFDTLLDPAGNRLDGENNASEPQESPRFPTGDGVSGGHFVARFTVDSRPEVGTYSFGAAYVDVNGNGVFDPDGADNDQTNRDLTFVFGNRGDQLFAGNFAPVGAASASDFDKLAAFGQVGGSGGPYRFLIDFGSDGVADLSVTSLTNGNGAVAFAGNFAPGHPGDEIGIFNGQKWTLDTNANYVLGDAGDLVLQGNLQGAPIIGDFDGDGRDDLAAYKDGVFAFDLASNGLTGNADATINFGFAGPSEQPVAADLNLDGIDDVGLFLPQRNGPPPIQVAEWFWLVSAGTPVAGTVSTLNHPFKPAPLGTDQFFKFGSELAKPIVGNFDPPVTATAAAPAPTLEGTAGPPYTLSLVPSGAGAYRPSTWSVTWGDGQVETVPGDRTVVTHDYGSAPGVYSVAATTTNGTNTVGAANTLRVTVNLGSASERYVAQLYVDLLHRQVDPSGLVFWSGILDQGVPRTQVVQAIQGSEEYRTLTVQGLYQQFLHRAADGAGLNYWVAFLGAGGTPTQLQALITGSPEYFRVRGAGTSAGFLDAIYQDVLGRAVDPAGRQVFSAALAAGVSPGQVADVVFRSSEYQQRLVAGLYDGFLQRTADGAGLDYWSAALRAGTSDADVLAAVVGSEEYFRRV